MNRDGNKRKQNSGRYLDDAEYHYVNKVKAVLVYNQNLTKVMAQAE